VDIGHETNLTNFKNALISTAKRRLYPTSDFAEADGDIRLSMFYAEYGPADYLLCHDDKLKGRRFAYILYLVDEEWNEEDGGHLDLMDKTGTAVVKSLLPKRGQLVIFEVCPGSFHQVREVIGTRTRKSVTGWFMGETEWIENEVGGCTESKTTELVTFETFPDPGAAGYDEIETSVNPVYMDLNTQGQIQDNFLDESEIVLPDFIVPDLLNSLEAELNRIWGNKTLWKPGCGQKNRGTWTTSTSNSFEECPALNKILNVLNSEAFAILLSNWTGLSLHETAEDFQKGQQPTYNVSINCYQAGDYSLIRDSDFSETPTLDAFLFLAVPDIFSDVDLRNEASSESTSQCGGDVIYLAKGESEELITLRPTENTLSLVYRDETTLYFHKYLNHKFKGKFFEIHAQYKTGESASDTEE